MPRWPASAARARASLLLALVASGGGGCEEAPPPIEELVDYARDVQPILAERCFGCHGPDEAGRAAGLRLDTFADATADRGGGRFAIVPRDPDASLLLQRAELADPTLRMPPAPRPALSAAELTTLRRWIAGGAAYERHWAFERLERPPVPAGSSHPVDAFVRRGLAEAGLTPSPRAEPAALVRRLSLDVRGLPPSPEELDAFVADPSDAAYEALLDRWLAEPAHAERLATDWLDGAGYGDTAGLHADEPLESWVYRDWVIARFAENRPLDAMIVAQLAGDLLPGATDDDVLATGYLRLHPTTGEGGIDPEERRLAHSMHRARTVGNHLLGLTVQCAQCHDHKYDPISQRDVYSWVACFDRVADRGLVDSAEANAPTLEAVSPLWALRREPVVARLAVLDARLAEADVTSALEAWARSLGAAAPARFEAPESLSASALASFLRVDADGGLRASGSVPTTETWTLRVTHDAPIRAVQLELGSGRSAVLPWVTEITLDVEGPTSRRRARVARAFLGDGTDAGTVTDGLNTTGLETPGTALTLVPEAPIDTTGGALVIRVDQRHGRASVFGSARVLLSSDEAAVLSPPLASVVARPRAEWTREQEHTLRLLHAETTPGSVVHAEARERAALAAELAEGDSAVATRVMREDDPGRRTHVLVGGQWGQLGEPVRCAVPATLRIDRPIDVADRLGVARWLVGPDNPITARVLAARYFQLAFRHSLVATPDDWGTRGAPPSHPELLDWLADELRSHWDLRALLRLLFTSETYRQSSVASEALLATDPTNRWLARSERVRLDVEILRDQALAASGLLEPRLGGRPGFVAHPDGLYEALGDGLGALSAYPVDRDPARQHRRTLYAFWRRGLLHPGLALLDAPDRLHGVARREETSTPTQALALQNDPHFVEAARALAERARRAHPDDVEERIADIFRRVLSRRPTAEESALLRASYDAELAEVTSDGTAVAITGVGESDVASDDPAADAALTLVARAVLGTSEAITRP